MDSGSPEARLISEVHGEVDQRFVLFHIILHLIKMLTIVCKMDMTLSGTAGAFYHIIICLTDHSNRFPKVRVQLP